MGAIIQTAFQALFSLIKKNGLTIVRFAQVGSLIMAFHFLAGLIGDLIHRGYSEITSAASNLAANHLPSAMGCVMHYLGIDSFLTSAFAIFFTSAIFWGSSVLTIIGARASIKLLKTKMLQK